MKIAFIDTETTGLDHKLHRVVECSCSVYEKNKSEKQKLIAKISFVQKPDLSKVKFEKSAIEANKYDEDDPSWKSETKMDTPEAAQWWLMLSKITSGCHLAGQNVQFDKDFIESEMIKHKVEIPEFKRRKFDVTSMSSIIASNFGMEECGLEQVHKAFFSSKNLPSHRAAADVERSCDIYFLFYDLFEDKFFKNEAEIEYDHKILERAMKNFGFYERECHKNFTEWRFVEEIVCIPTNPSMSDYRRRMAEALSLFGKQVGIKTQSEADQIYSKISSLIQAKTLLGN